ncbi:hypothetical protein DH09_03935 [Bacillaceae bacterium JMAK1]|nr:hypothetical protein DH09_03935 [Bacillaceae bacterium JMAK1]
MNQKIVFLDIDGTIYNEEKQMSKATKQAVQQLQERGHHVVIATGRAPFMYNELKKELNITTHIGFNGSYVVLDEQVVLAKSLDKDALKAIRLDAQEKGHPMVVMDHLGARTNIAVSDRIRECMNSLHLPYPNVVKDPFEGEIYQGLLFSKVEEAHGYEDNYPQFDFVRWHDLSLDLIPSGGSKAVGIKKVADLLHIDMKDTIAFGDGLNDIEMLQAAGTGVAMGNGKDVVKSVADFTTTHVDDEGIYEGLKKLALLS